MKILAIKELIMSGRKYPENIDLWSDEIKIKFYDKKYNLLVL